MDEITGIVLAAKICSEVHVVIGTYIGNLNNNIYQFVLGTADKEVIVYKDITEVSYLPFVNLKVCVTLKDLCERFSFCLYSMHGMQIVK